MPAEPGELPPQQAQQEVTVEMQQPTLGSAGGGRGGRVSPVAAAEVTSRPVLSASVMGTAVPRRAGGGHEVSSLNSGEEASRATFEWSS